jgi:hypothetical protein
MSATLGEDIRTWLLADTAIAAVVGGRVHQNKAGDRYLGPYIWYGRATTQNEDALDDSAGTKPFSQIFDIESISDDIDEALSIADMLKAKHLARGTFGGGKVQGVFVSDHADDYIPRGSNSDDGLHVAALQLEFMGYTQGA